MKVEIKVPSLGESITEATVGTILKPNGSYVNADEEILELETEKVNQLLYAPQSGLLSLNVNTEAVVKIGQVLGTIETEAQNKGPKEEHKVETKPPEEKKLDFPKVPSKTESDTNARYSTQEFISQLKGKESEKKKIEETELPPSKPSEKGRETRRRMSMIRRVIANRMVEAKQTTAMLTTFNEVDMSQVIAIRERDKEDFQKKYGVKLGFMSFFIKATVSALEKYPEINSYIDGDEIVQREYYDIGVAVGTDRGLVVPVIKDCDKLSFSEIEKSIETFAKKAREGEIAVEDLRGGGFTITNGGVYGSLLSTPILNPPQSGILGMHKIEKRPIVVNDQIVIRPMMYLALSYDHRIVDGKQAVGFLIQIKQILEDPMHLIF